MEERTSLDSLLQDSSKEYFFGLSSSEKKDRVEIESELRGYLEELDDNSVGRFANNMFNSLAKWRDEHGDEYKALGAWIPLAQFAQAIIPMPKSRRIDLLIKALESLKSLTEQALLLEVTLMFAVDFVIPTFPAAKLTKVFSILGKSIKLAKFLSKSEKLKSRLGDLNRLVTISKNIHEANQYYKDNKNEIISLVSDELK